MLKKDLFIRLTPALSWRRGRDKKGEDCIALTFLLTEHITRHFNRSETLLVYKKPFHKVI